MRDGTLDSQTGDVDAGDTTADTHDPGPQPETTGQGAHGIMPMEATHLGEAASKPTAIHEVQRGGGWSAWPECMCVRTWAGNVETQDLRRPRT